MRTILGQLPNVQPKNMFLDVETTSGNPKETSVNPWRHCDIAGIAFTFDDCETGWYLPVNHHTGMRMDRGQVARWVQDMIDQCERWINHNIKYDAQVLTNIFGTRIRDNMTCTLAGAKIINSDRMYSGGYGLDALSKAWTGVDISHHEQIMKPYLHRNKDFGAVPPDIMAEYAIDDVNAVRRLLSFIETNLPPDCQRVYKMEQDLVYALYLVERVGLRVDPQMLRVVELQVLQRLQQLHVELENILGRSMNPSSSEDCFDVLCNQFGLPVVKWTEADEEDGEAGGNPSFDVEALAMYRALPLAPSDVITRIQEYRKLNTFNGLFVKKLQQLHVNGRVHATYNASVRTGRMSAKNPNAQQFSMMAKALILPDPDGILITVDYSQIEFRLIVHYINDAAAIHAYNTDPSTDFHTWVANLIHIQRRPAKNCNFMMGYGGGRKKLVRMLAQMPDVVDEIILNIERAQLTDSEYSNAVQRAAAARAEHIYDTYHDHLPGIRRTSRRVEQVARQRGYVFNLYGRRRHLPRSHAHIGFNSINQSTAADIMKEGLIKCMKTGARIAAVVHDEIVIYATRDFLETDLPRIRELLESPGIPLRVPIKTSFGWSERSWKHAAESAKS